MLCGNYKLFFKIVSRFLRDERKRSYQLLMIPDVNDFKIIPLKKPFVYT